MSWLILCPTCGKMLEIDENSKSTPNAKYKLIDEFICGNCGRDMRVSLKRAVNVIIPELIAYKTK